MARKIPTTKNKALEINLRAEVYGSFAEIGAGQEVARYFFQAGGASGTVAQTISAYDMVFSDAIYGKEASGRYVCESRLRKMLTKEYGLLVERLDSIRGDKTQFFAFADTVTTKAFNRDNESHGWMGIRFQESPKSKPTQVVIHVRMLDQTAQEQQKHLGIIGVNLIHACYNYFRDWSDFLNSLMDHVETTQLEIDMIHVEGEGITEIDNRLLNVDLVKKGYTNAIMFGKNGETILPADVLYKKNILAVRGSYRPPTLVSLDILKTSLNNFLKDYQLQQDEVVTVAEITVSNLTDGGQFNNDDFLARVDMLCALNQQVLVSNYPEYYRLSSYFSRFSPKHLGIVLGVFNFKQIFDAEYNQNLKGGVLESLGLLFRDFVKVYIYPYQSEKDQVLVTSQSLSVKESDQYLYNYLKSNSQIKDITDYDPKILHIYSRKVLNMILNKEPGWEKLVPESVADTIKKKCLFGQICDI
jgi:hypothetical protein